MNNIKSFSKTTLPFELPNFLDLQRKSWERFWDEKIEKLFHEVFPVPDYSGKRFQVEFLGFELGEPNFPNHLQAKDRDESYTAPLKARFRLVNLKNKKTRTEEVFLADFPMMSNRGSFVIRGVERVVVAQIIRSPGVFFESQFVGGYKRFGAVLVPDRGSWLEFETDRNGLLQVKINRRKKVLATTFLRALGFSTDSEIEKLFKDIDKGETAFITNTLAEDPTKNEDEAAIEIYHRLRPSEMVTADTAKEFLKNMFFNFSRYDLAEVGRWKIRERLPERKSKKAISMDDRVLQSEDVVATIREIIRLNNNPGVESDSIDHLGNRRIRDLAELLQSQLRIGLARIRRVAQDRMSTLGDSEISPSRLIDPRLLAISLQNFFGVSAFSQFMDSDNPLAETEHKRRLSATGPGGLTRQRAGFDARDVQPSHYGRICPIETPEGPNVGLVNHLTAVAEVNEYGFIETPYFRVNGGKITSEVVYLNANEEEKYRIAQADTLLDDKNNIINKKVMARFQGHPMMADRNKIEFMDVSPNQTISIAASLIPFLRNDDANRALMGCNMQRQAVPLIKAERPLVGTGMEEKVARESGQIVLAEENGVVKEADAQHIKVNNKTYVLQNFVRGNQFTCYHQQPVVSPGDKVKKGDALTNGSSIADGALALGTNITVAFMLYRGMNYEDAIVVSERLAKNNTFASIHIENLSCEVRNTKLGPELTTSDIPNVSEEKLKDLDERGVVRIGAEVGPGDILVGKISPKGQVELSPEERLVKAIFGEKAKEVKDTSLTMPYGKKGRVVGVKVFSRDRGDRLESGTLQKITIEIAQVRNIETGDKISGRHGNKGIIAEILPEEEMPFLEDGTPVDVILSPMGVVSRMNVGQILETHIGWAAEKLNRFVTAPALIGISEQDIKKELKEAGLPENGQSTLYDGRTGEPFARSVTVGKMYMLKLHHMVQDKIHMRSIGPYSLITQQPLGGKAQFGGQRFGEMEVWALEGYGAAYTLQEMMTIKSDDIRGRSEAYEAILRGKPIENYYRPASLILLLNELKSLALDIQVIGQD
jgi:DNA-directed RNA polymerase subunit beta